MSDRLKWLLVLLGFSALAMAFSSRAFLSLSMVEWEQEFGWSRSSIAGAGAIGLIVMAAIAPLVGYSVDRFGARPVLTTGLLATALGTFVMANMTTQATFFIAYSVISALGFGIVSMHVVVASVAPLFDRHRGLATGIATSGATGGQLFFVPAFSIVLAGYGWRVGYSVMAALTLVTAAILWFVLRSARRDMKVSPVETKQRSLKNRLGEVIGKRAFYALFFSFALCGFTTAGVVETHFLPYAAVCGYSPVMSATAFGVLSAFNLLGMIIAGYLADRMNNTVLLFSIYFLRALSFVALLYIGTDMWMLFAFSVMFGLFDYSTVPVTANLVAKHLGLHSMGLVMGLLAMGHALGAAAGAWVGGLIFVAFTSYLYVWLGSVALALLSAMFVLMLPQEGSRNPREAQPT